MSIRSLHAFLSVALTLATVTAAEATEPSAQGHPCTTVTDPGARLACYDAAFPPAVVTPPGEHIQAEREKQLGDFGLTKVQLRERDPERMGDVSPDQIEAAVARLGSRPTGERVVTLDSGQVWLLTEVTSRGYLTTRRSDRHP